MSIITDYLEQVSRIIRGIPEEKVQDVVDTLAEAIENNRQIFLLGNGGSAANASHISEDLLKGVKECAGRRARVFALTDSVPLITAWANDTSYENVFSEQIDSLLNPGDVVIAISGSGNSPNVIKAVEKANQMGGVTLGWSGYAGGRLAQVAQKPIVIPSDNMQRIEDAHLVLGHLVYTALVSQLGPAKS